MGARDLLLELAEAGVAVAVDGDRLVIRPASRLTEAMRSALREAKPDILAMLTHVGAEPAKPTPRLTDMWPVEPWDEVTCTRFADRVTLFMRRGLSVSDAEDLAALLVRRDGDGQDMHLCLECRHLSGYRTNGWRCQAYRQARVPPALPADLVTQLQRCPAFSAVSSPNGVEHPNKTQGPT